MRTLILDTVDRFYPHVVDAVCSEEGVSHPSEGSYGKVWSAVKKRFEKIIQKINMKDVAFVMISHQSEKKIVKKHTEIDRLQPDLPKSGLDIVHDLSDLILWYGFDDNDDRRLFGKPKEGLITGCRGGIQIDSDAPSFETINEAVASATGKGFMEVQPTVLIYGPPKIGKSTLAMEFPDPVILDFENGYRFLDISKDSLHICNDYATAEKALVKIFQNGDESEPAAKKAGKEKK